jgi:hypothetical protein
LQQQIQKNYNGLTLKQPDIDNLRNLFFSMINVELIVENLSGLVFFGLGETEIYPSTSQVLAGATIRDVPRVRFFDPIKIIPGKLDANILIV